MIAFIMFISFYYIYEIAAQSNLFPACKFFLCILQMWPEKKTWHSSSSLGTEWWWPHSHLTELSEKISDSWDYAFSFLTGTFSSYPKPLYVFLSKMWCRDIKSSSLLSILKQHRNHLFYHKIQNINENTLKLLY